MVKDYLDDQELVDDNAGTVLPAGLVIKSIRIVEPSKGDKENHALFTVVWELSGPDTTDAVFFTVFPSVSAAEASWQEGKRHPYPQFRVESVSWLEDWGYAAYLLNGSIGSGGDLQGFSDAFAQVGNISIRSTTISGLTTFGANSHLAVAMVRNTISALILRFGFVD